MDPRHTGSGEGQVQLDYPLAAAIRGPAGVGHGRTRAGNIDCRAQRKHAGKHVAGAVLVAGEPDLHPPDGAGVSVQSEPEVDLIALSVRDQVARSPRTV